MKNLAYIIALCLAGCSGLAVSLTYTPPMTVGMTFDARPLFPPTTQPQVKP